MTDDEKIQAVTAGLNGHDIRQWFEPSRSASSHGENTWFVMRKDSEFIYFSSEESAWHFYKTGTRLSTMTKDYDKHARSKTL